MSDGEKIPLIEYHSVNPVKYTSLEEQTNTRSYLYKLIVCNICIIINILTIFLIRTAIGVLYFLNPALSIKLEALIITIIVTIYISLGGLTLVKICLTRKILTISKQFNIHMNKICVVLIIFIILIVVDLSLYIAYCYTISDNEIKKTLLVISSTSMLFACIIILIEIGYKDYFIANNLLLT